MSCLMSQLGIQKVLMHPESAAKVCIFVNGIAQNVEFLIDFLCGVWSCIAACIIILIQALGVFIRLNSYNCISPYSFLLYPFNNVSATGNW